MLANGWLTKPGSQYAETMAPFEPVRTQGVMVSSQYACTTAPSDAVRAQGVSASRPSAREKVMEWVNERTVEM